MVAVQAESMVGGTIFHRWVIQREISRVLVLKPLWQQQRCSKHRQEIFVLDSPFALIEGHPGIVPISRVGHPPFFRSCAVCFCGRLVSDETGQVLQRWEHIGPTLVSPLKVFYPRGPEVNGCSSLL